MAEASLVALPDPRVFPAREASAGEASDVYAAVEASLGAATAADADVHDRQIVAVLERHLVADGKTLAALHAGAPSVPVARHLWRLLDRLWRDTADPTSVLPVVFALPIVVVAARESEASAKALSGVVHDSASLAAMLVEHGALGGNRTFGLANALVGAESIDVHRLPEIRAWQRLPPVTADAGWQGPALVPAPIAIGAGHEAVSLRFLVGSAMAGTNADFLGTTSVGTWGMPFAQALARALAAPGVSVLALPRAPQRPLQAVQQGRLAQREVSAQLFVGNALRRMRAESGEPTAVLSAHRAPDAPGGGELRLSLSSPFAARDAEGFRCPLHFLDRVGDVADMLVSLLRDCRVADIRIVSGVQPDRDASTGLPLLFKPDSIPANAVAH